MTERADSEQRIAILEGLVAERNALATDLARERERTSTLTDAVRPVTTEGYIAGHGAGALYCVPLKLLEPVIAALAASSSAEPAQEPRG